MANKVELYNNGTLIGTDNAPVIISDTVTGEDRVIVYSYSIAYPSEIPDDALTSKLFKDNVEVASSGVRNVVVNENSAMPQVANYPMTETTGDVIDVIGGNNGVITGWVDRDGTKYTFQGTTGFVTIPDNEASSFVSGGSDLPFEIEFKIKLDNLTKLQGIISKRDSANPSAGLQEWQIYYDHSDSSLRLSLYQNGNHNLGSIERGVAGLTSEAEYDIKFKYDGSKTRAGITIELNGVPVTTYVNGTATSYTGMINTTVPVMFGKLNNGTNNFLFKGTLRDVKIRKG